MFAPFVCEQRAPSLFRVSEDWRSMIVLTWEAMPSELVTCTE